jgi:hypothetical protein
MTNSPQPRRKSKWVAYFLALFFGPIGLLYVSWRWALLMLVIFLVGVLLFPGNALVFIGLWFIAPASTVLCFRVNPPRLAPVSAGNRIKQPEVGGTGGKA